MWTCPTAPEGFEWRLVAGPEGHGLAMIHFACTGHTLIELMTWRTGWALKLDVHRYRHPRIVTVPSRDRGIYWANRRVAVNREMITAELVVPSVLDAPFELRGEPRSRRRQRTPFS